jgi:hypothetical protein
MPKGKALAPCAAAERMAARDFFDIIHRVDENTTLPELERRGKTKGDIWLAYRGRRVVPGPELRRGRKNLYDVVHHTCVEGLKENPNFTGHTIKARYSTSSCIVWNAESARGVEQFCCLYKSHFKFAGGDEWLERKGKRNVLGPEQRRGRKDLFETLQQSSNPWLDGRTLDDAFLERKGKAVLNCFVDNDLYSILQDRDIKVAPAPALVKRYYIDELVPIDGSLTTRTVPSLTKRIQAL